MYSDDIFALAIDIGHSKSVIGYAGDETPKYYTDSTVGHVISNSHQTTLHQNGDMGLESGSGMPSKYVFGEHIAANLKNVEIDSLLENGVCKLFEGVEEYLSEIEKMLFTLSDLLFLYFSFFFGYELLESAC